MTATLAQTVPVPRLSDDLAFLDITTGWDTETPFQAWRASIVVPAAFRPAFAPARVIVVANQKGGVGKTVTSLELALAYVAAGFRVRLIDADPQKAALTVWLKEICYPADLPVAERRSLTDVFFDRCTLKDATYPTIYKGLFFVPSGPDLGTVDTERPPGADTCLQHHLRKPDPDIDIDIIDSGPNLGTLTVAALAAAHDVLIAIQDGGLELHGANSLAATIKRVQVRLNEELSVRGIFFTDFEKTTLSRTIGAQMTKAFPNAIIVPVRESVRVGEASLARKPLRFYAPGVNPILDYDRAAGILITRKAG
ncbi:ParA family protein [Kitasatospora sp. NPDC087315]|uniref:ParA family protein n=1 Tax=Kitasatospora sp. NPDC087315 TaxID=3364069 RepID=UPI0038027D5B